MKSVRSRVPTRIDFAGGWTDVPDFADREGGTVVNAAIDPPEVTVGRVSPRLRARARPG